MPELLTVVALAALAGGIALAGRWCKSPVSQVLVGLLLGVGLLVGLVLVLLGVLFAGCLVAAQGGRFR